jgi:hypothetical protein
MGQGKTNKRKGSNGERLYAKLFRELGYIFCQTSRLESRLHDNCGIDLTNLPFNVQVKVGYDRGLNIKNVIEYTKNQIKELMPPTKIEHELPTIVIHRKTVGQGNKRQELDDLVYMSFEDFKKILDIKNKND